jgi:hypothetical protein
MEKYIAGKRSMECRQKQLGGLVRNKIKHWKKYKIIPVKKYLNLVKGR